MGKASLAATLQPIWNINKTTNFRMLVFEDSETGCKAAVASGAITVAVPSGHSRRHSFSGAELIATSLADARIYELLNSHVERKNSDNS